MSNQIEPIARLVNQLSKLPGIGKKSAQRLAFYIVSRPEEQVRELAVSIFNAKREATQGAREAFEQKRAAAKANFTKRVEGMTDRQKLIRMYENLKQEIKTAENNILFFSGNTKSANALVASMQKKIDALKDQLKELEDKIENMD